MKERIRCSFLVLALGLLIAFIRPQTLLAGSSGSTTNEIEPGTTINQQNWRRYRNFMPEGLAAFRAITSGIFLPFKHPGWTDDIHSVAEEVS